MIILLYGPDSYRRLQKQKEIVENYKQKQSLFSVEFFDLEADEELPRLKDFINQQLIFEGKKMAIVENSFILDAKNIKIFKEFLKNNVKNDEVILIVSDANELPKELEFLSHDAFNKQEFKNLDDEKMKFFIKSETKKRELNLSDSAVYFLAAFFKNNTWGLISELDKIGFLNNDKINVEDLEKTGDYFQSPNLFNFITAVSRNYRIQDKIKNLELLFMGQEESAGIFNILASRPFISFDLLKKMADYDVLIKSGRLDYETALLDLCLG